jgi:glutathione reductase (NADPH)
MKQYDLVVIGSGIGGTSAAYQCREKGWQVAVIDKHPVGGTCALRGCDPKKILVGAAEIIDRIHRMEGRGVTEGSSLDWSDLIAFKRTFTDPVPDSRTHAFKEAGIDVFRGVASFISENEVKVNEVLLESRHFLISSGAKPRPLDIEGSSHILHSDDFLELASLPETIAFIGGGFISMEFAHIAAQAGSQVHVIVRSSNILKQFDQDLVSLLIKRSEEIGIKFHFDTKLQSVSKQEDGFVVSGTQNDENFRLACDLVFHGAGRVPDLEDLDPDKGNIQTEKRGVTVNEYLQSVSNPIVYAAGDAAASAGLPLTPIAAMESYAVAANLLEGNHQKPDYELMPSTVFTLPSLALVGLTETKAMELGIEIEVNRMDTSEWYTYKRINEPYAMVKTIINKENGHLIGAHVLGSNADVLINHFAVIMHFKLPFDEIKKMNFAYPTTASDLPHLL